MAKKKGQESKAFDKEGPQDLPDGFAWCPQCQAAYQGEVCPGCSAERGQAGEPVPDPVAEDETGQESPILPSPPGSPDGEAPDPNTLGEVAEQASTETTTTTEILPVPLTDSEHKEISKMMAAANQEIVQAEIELKAVKTQYKSRMESAEARRQEYSDIINAGHQQRPVECHLVKDFTANTITLIRLDTGEIVRTRTMNATEKQRGLNFEE